MYYGIVKPVAIVRGKVSSELVKGRWNKVPNLMGKGETIPQHEGLGWQIQPFQKSGFGFQIVILS
jgi:hypothetical protein